MKIDIKIHFSIKLFKPSGHLIIPNIHDVSDNDRSMSILQIKLIRSHTSYSIIRSEAFSSGFSAISKLNWYKLSLSEFRNIWITAQ